MGALSAPEQMPRGCCAGLVAPLQLCRESPSSSQPAPAPALPGSSLASSAGKMLLHVRNSQRFKQQDVTLRTFTPHCWSSVFCRLGRGGVLPLGWGFWTPGILGSQPQGSLGFQPRGSLGFQPRGSLPWFQVKGSNKRSALEHFCPLPHQGQGVRVTELLPPTPPSLYPTLFMNTPVLHT